jgi:hypothetical protein
MNDRDPEFATKAVAVIELLLSPPTDGPLFCVDEKPGIGVRQPTSPDQPAAPGRTSRREFEYKRNGTVDLLAGFCVNDGRVCGMVRLKHRSREFCELLGLLDEQTPRTKSINPSHSRSSQLALVRRGGGLVGQPPAAQVRIPFLTRARVLAEFH